MCQEHNGQGWLKLVLALGLSLSLIWLKTFDSITHSATFFIIFSMLSLFVVGLSSVARE